jgi:hypothetical protein
VNFSIGNDLLEIAKIDENEVKIDGSKIYAKSIVASEAIVEGSITADELHANSVTSTKIAADAIEVGHISSGAASSLDLSSNDSIKLVVTNQSANLFPSDPSNWEQGSISTVDGSLAASTTRIRSAGYITLNVGTLYTVSRLKSLSDQIILHYYNNSNAYIGNSGSSWITIYPYSFSLPSGATKMRILIRRLGATATAPTDVPDILFSIMPVDISGGVKTSKIEIGSDFINIESGGRLTLNAVDDIKIGSGGGTLASTIDLSANNSIKLAVSGGTNLLLNSDWSQGLQSSWETSGPGFLDTNASYLYNGKTPLRLVVDAGVTYRYSTQTVGVNIRDTNKFTLSFRYRVTSSNLTLAGSGSVVSISCLDSANVTISGGYFYIYPSTLTGSASWERREFSFAVPAGTEKIRMYIYARSDGVSSNFIHFSDVQLEKGT